MEEQQLQFNHPAQEENLAEEETQPPLLGPEEIAPKQPLPGPEDSPIREAIENQEVVTTPRLEEAMAESNDEALAPEEIIVIAAPTEVKEESQQEDIPEQTS